MASDNRRGPRRKLVFIAVIVGMAVFVIGTIMFMQTQVLSHLSTGLRNRLDDLVPKAPMKVPSGLLLPPSMWTSSMLRDHACQLTVPDGIDDAFDRLWSLPEPRTCDPSVRAAATKLQQDSLVEIPGACSGKLFYRVFDGLYLAKKRPLHGSVDIGDAESIIVRCEVGSSVSFDFHTRARLQQSLVDKAVAQRVTQTRSAAKLSFLVLMIDSLTREHALRTLPRTLDFLLRQQTMSVFDYTRFNTVGKGTKMNFTPVMFGNVSDIFVKSKTFTSLNDHFAARGYVTAFLEEACINNTGSMGRIVRNKVKEALNQEERIEFMKAFRALSDHSFGNVMCEVMKEMKVSNFFSENTKKKICFAGSFMHEFMLHYLTTFFDAYAEQPDTAGAFAILKTNEAHEKSYQRVALMDEHLLAFVKSLTTKHPNLGILLMGDHGIGYGELSETFTLSMEYNLPALFLALPKSYTSHLPPTLLKNLHDNQNRLVNGMDLHATLVDLSLSAHEEGVLPPTRGRSFLRPMTDQSCQELGIPLSRCSCSVITEEDATDVKWSVVADVLVEDVSSSVARWQEQCFRIRKQGVTKVRKVQSNSVVSVVHQLTVQVAPDLPSDNAHAGIKEEFVFEIQPKKMWDDPNSLGVVKRITLFGVRKDGVKEVFDNGLVMGVPDELEVEIDWDTTTDQKDTKMSAKARRARLIFTDAANTDVFSHTIEVQADWLVSKSRISDAVFLSPGDFKFSLVDEVSGVVHGTAQMTVLDLDKPIVSSYLDDQVHRFYETLSVTRQSSFAQYSVCVPVDAPADRCLCHIP